MKHLLILSPLEQFEVIPLLGFTIVNLNVYFLNSTVLFLSSFCMFFIFTRPFYSTVLLPKSTHQILFEQLYLTVGTTLIANSGKINQKFFPHIFNLTIVLLFSNIFGMLPFGFTLTSHIVVTFFLAFSMFFCINIVGIAKHGRRFMALFLPSGTPFVIMPFLFLIELLSYTSRVFSLAIRLFANMMSGHTLLSILTAFLMSSFAAGGVYLFVNLIPLLVLHVVVFMEICIAILQVYVFIVLSCIYLHDVTDVNH